MKTSLVTFSIAALLVLPSIASAHGALEKITEGKYLLNLTSAPLAPMAGQEQQNILAVSDLQENVIPHTTFSVEVRKDDKVLFHADKLVATGGLLSFHYTYPASGLYELAASFRIGNDPHVYNPEDYWVEVTARPEPATSSSFPIVPFAFAILIALAAGIGIGHSFLRQ